MPLTALTPQAMAPPIPRGLRGKARQFYADVTRDFELQDFHIELLRQACWALQRSEEARALVDAEGLTYADANGRKFPHPGAVIEKENRAAFTKIVRELGLDLASTEAPRAPSRGGRGRKRGAL